MFVLALSDAMAIGMWALNLIVSGAITLSLWRQTQTIARLQRTEDDRDRKVAAAEQRLHDANTKLIDERFRAMTHDLNGHVQRFGSTLDLLSKRIEDADRDVDGLYDVDHKIELEVANKIDGIKEYIRDRTASREDLKGHERSVAQKFDQTGERIGQLVTAVAVLTNKLEERK